MEVICEGCGTRFEAKNRRRRFHSDTCRKRAKREGGSQSAGGRVIPLGKGGAVRAAAQAALDELGAADSLLGQTVLALATRIDTGNETGAATAALSREMRAAMADAAAQAPRAASPVDELRQKRLERMGLSG